MFSVKYNIPVLAYSRHRRLFVTQQIQTVENQIAMRQSKNFTELLQILKNSPDML